MADACPFPLPGLVMTDAQRETVAKLTAAFARMQQAPGFLNQRRAWSELKALNFPGMLGARGVEAVATARAKDAMYDLPDQILSTVAGLAKQAQQQGEQQRPRATFTSNEEALLWMTKGRDMEALAAMPGWQAFSQMLAAFAWAMAWGVKNCKVEDAPHYIEARTQIVELLRSLQTVIDRGQDAAVWLERAAEEKQQETH